MLLQPQGLRERKNAEAKRALYNAAMDLFRQKGFDATSVDDIVERAGFSRATFFNHFGAKKGVLRYYGQEIQNRVEELIERTDSVISPIELIGKIIFSMASEAEGHREELKLIYCHSMRDPEYLFDPTPARKRVMEVFTELLIEAGKRGEIRRDIPAGEIAFNILAVYWGLLLAIIAGAGNFESLLHAAWQFILGGIKGGNCSAR